MLAPLPYSGIMMGCFWPWWSYRGMLSSWARVLTMAAPMRRPVKEPGPDMNSISAMSCQDLSFSASLSLMNCKSFSAKSWPKS